MPPKHFTIPVFIPHLACPFRCVFCDQRRISGTMKVPGKEEIQGIVESHLATIGSKSAEVEIGFFGGSFTALPLAEQEAYLETAGQYLEDGKISGIRLSTRPDCIEAGILKMLKQHGVTAVELGAQSMDDEVLRLSGRGHTVRDVETASALILEHGFVLGLQMMAGLPGDTEEKSLRTARRIVELGASETRVYPALVIRGTRLEQLYREGKYTPLSLETAVAWAKEICKIFEAAEVKVIRMGLHPSEGLLSGDSLAAGPFHPSFRELVMTELWWEALSGLAGKAPGPLRELLIRVPDGQVNAAAGYGAANRKKLLGSYRCVRFRSDPSLKGREYHADLC